MKIFEPMTFKQQADNLTHSHIILALYVISSLNLLLVNK